MRQTRKSPWDRAPAAPRQRAHATERRQWGRRETAAAASLQARHCTARAERSGKNTRVNKSALLWAVIKAAKGKATRGQRECSAAPRSSDSGRRPHAAPLSGIRFLLSAICVHLHRVVSPRSSVSSCRWMIGERRRQRLMRSSGRCDAMRCARCSLSAASCAIRHSFLLPHPASLNIIRVCTHHCRCGGSCWCTRLPRRTALRCAALQRRKAACFSFLFLSSCSSSPAADALHDSWAARVQGGEGEQREERGEERQERVSLAHTPTTTLSPHSLQITRRSDRPPRGHSTQRFTEAIGAGCIVTANPLFVLPHSLRHGQQAQQRRSQERVGIGCGLSGRIGRPPRTPGQSVRRGWTRSRWGRERCGDRATAVAARVRRQPAHLSARNGAAATARLRTPRTSQTIPQMLVTQPARAIQQLSASRRGVCSLTRCLLTVHARFIFRRARHASVDLR